MAELKSGRIHDACHHQVESEWMSEGVICANGGEATESEVFFVQMVWTNICKSEVSLRVKTKMAESKMAEINMVEYKMAAIIKLSENEWVWVRLN